MLNGLPQGQIEIPTRAFILLFPLLSFIWLTVRAAQITIAIILASFWPIDAVKQPVTAKSTGTEPYKANGHSETEIV